MRMKSEMQKNKTEICKLCGNYMTPHYKAKGFLICKCSHCSFEQVKMDSYAERFEYEASYFDNSKYRDLTALRHEHKRRISILKKYATSDSKVVDYGCATGEFVEYACKEFDISGCDVSEDAIRIAQEKYPTISEKFSLVDNFLNESDQYDMVTLWDVLEHIEYPLNMTIQLSEKVKEGGYLILSTPNIGSLFARIMKSYWPFMTPPEHLVFFTKRSMAYLAKKAGFDICEWYARGKWANVGFILYKFNRVSRIKIPRGIVNLFTKGWLAKLRVYVPTHDIQYVVMKKRDNN